jgi:hypothetical protein
LRVLGTLDDAIVFFFASELKQIAYNFQYVQRSRRESIEMIGKAAVAVVVLVVLFIEKTMIRYELII